jgi:hypothetical protein
MTGSTRFNTTEFIALSDTEGAQITGGAFGPLLMGLVIGIAVAIVNEVLHNWSDFKKGLYDGLDGK